ncbi:MAG: hypothetical protein GX638_12990 [Crenarchaeota archaeon]|nr:hypothetical protein [Thermoproteota archaeon]
MLKKIKVIPLAAESLGVRSMCTLVQTPDVVMLLDPGVSLCPMRYGLPPHPEEFRRIMQLREAISSAAKTAQVVTVSHYHYDHHTPDHEDWLVNWTEAKNTARQIYQDKYVLAKNYYENINKSQRERALTFQRSNKKIFKKFEFSDGKSFCFGNQTQMVFSEAVYHGSQASGLGYVVLVSIICGDERFVFAPDVQGPMIAHTTDLIKTAHPQLLMIGGPPFHLLGTKVTNNELEKAVLNLKELVKVIPTIIIDHHMLRDSNWKIKLSLVEDTAVKCGHKLVTAAEFLGKENHLLESKRNFLYLQNPPSKAFQNWMTQSGFEQSHLKPPL